MYCITAGHSAWRQGLGSRQIWTETTCSCGGSCQGVRTQRHGCGICCNTSWQVLSTRVGRLFTTCRCFLIHFGRIDRIISIFYFGNFLGSRSLLAHMLQYGSVSFTADATVFVCMRLEVNRCDRSSSMSLLIFAAHTSLATDLQSKRKHVLLCSVFCAYNDITFFASHLQGLKSGHLQ
jgi:hypothetical protein